MPHTHRHCHNITMPRELPRKADGILVKQAQVEVASGILDLVERTVSLVKGGGEEEE